MPFTQNMQIALQEIRTGTKPGTKQPVEEADLPYLRKVLADPKQREAFEHEVILFEGVSKSAITYAIWVFRRLHKNPVALRMLIKSGVDYLLADPNGESMASLLLPVPTAIACSMLYYRWTPEEIAREDELRKILINERILPDLNAALQSGNVDKCRILLALDGSTLSRAILPNTAGWTALFKACSIGNAQITGILLNEPEWKVELTTTDVNKKFAWEHALEQQHMDCVLLFVKKAIETKQHDMLSSIIAKITSISETNATIKYANIQAVLSGIKTLGISSEVIDPYIQQLTIAKTAIEAELAAKFQTRLDAIPVTHNQAELDALNLLRTEISNATPEVKALLPGDSAAQLLARLDARREPLEAAITAANALQTRLAGIAASHNQAELDALNQLRTDIGNAAQGVQTLLPGGSAAQLLARLDARRDPLSAAIRLQGEVTSIRPTNTQEEINALNPLLAQANTLVLVVLRDQLVREITARISRVNQHLQQLQAKPAKRASKCAMV